VKIGSYHLGCTSSRGIIIGPKCIQCDSSELETLVAGFQILNELMTLLVVDIEVCRCEFDMLRRFLSVLWSQIAQGTCGSCHYWG